MMYQQKPTNQDYPQRAADTNSMPAAVPTVKKCQHCGNAFRIAEGINHVNAVCPVCGKP